MIEYREEDAPDAFLYALEWRRQRVPPFLYWSMWRGWTFDIGEAYLLRYDEAERLVQLNIGHVLPLVAKGMWEPVFRLIPLYPARVTTACHQQEERV